MVTIFACTVCGQACGFLNDPCMACIRARARAAMTGRCPCGRKAIPGIERAVGSRRWIPCNRCLGTIRQLS